MRHKWILGASIGVTAALAVTLVLGLILWGGSTYNPQLSGTQPPQTEATAAPTGEPTVPPTAQTPTEPPTEEPTVPPTTAPEPTGEPTEPPTVAPPETDPPETQPPETDQPETSPPETQPVPQAQYSYVYDCGIGSTVYEYGDLDALIYPASITKLFTARVVLNHMALDTELTVGEELDFVAEDASRMYLKKDDTLTVKDLLRGMLLPSGNDAAYTLAAGTGRVIAGDPALSAADAVQVFVDEMNREAQAIGMTATHFAVPDGYHNDNHYTTPRDLLTLAKLTVENSTIMEICKLRAVTVTTREGRKLYCKNANPLLDKSSEYYCPEAVGLKTGYTKKAGQCLLAAFEENGRYVIVGVFKAATRDSRNREVLELWETYR